MAHFAKVNDQGIVEQVIVVNNSDCGGGDFPESESIGNLFLNSIGLTGNWKQTSYNGSFRRRYASIGCTYDSVNDVFILPQQFTSWTLDSNFDWQPPTPMPQEDGMSKYYWDESSLTWVKVDIPT